MIKLSKSQSSVFVALSSLLLCIIFWITLAPAKLGGWVTYVIVDGISMEPGFHLGDLVLVRTQPSYGVEDAVVYHDPNIGSYVFHRIIGMELDRFILQGDNNSWLDSYQPTQAEVIGKLWLHIPKVGKFIEWMRAPLNMALTVALMGVFLMIDVFQTPSQKNKKENPVPSFSFGGTATLLGFGFFAFLFLILGIYSFTRPLNRPTENISYQQEGYFYYSATGTPGVYDTEVVRSGEPVFPKLTCYLNIGFTYNVLSNNLQSMAGKQSMYARILDAQSGWQRTIPLTPETVFSGNTYFATTTLDLCQVESIVNLVEQETGLKQTAYTLEIVSDTSFTANANGILVNDEFSPKMVFKYDKIHFYLSEEISQPDPFYANQSGMAISSTSEQNTVSVLGFQIPVWMMRFVSLLGFGISLASAVFAGVNLYRKVNQNQHSLIQLKYGGMLVDVYEQNLAQTSSIIDVHSINDLARLAERHGTMILHTMRDSLNYYFVQNNGTTFRYLLMGKHEHVEEVQAPIVEITTPTEPIKVPTQLIQEDPVENSPKQNLRIVYVYQPQPEKPQTVLTHTQSVNAKPKIQESFGEFEYSIDTGKIEFELAQEIVLPRIKL